MTKTCVLLWKNKCVLTLITWPWLKQTKSENNRFPGRLFVYRLWFWRRNFSSLSTLADTILKFLTDLFQKLHPPRMNVHQWELYNPYFYHRRGYQNFRFHLHCKKYLQVQFQHLMTVIKMKMMYFVVHHH